MINKPKYLKNLTSPSSYVSLVINSLTNAILDGELNPGDKIPTEKELSENFGVSRNTIREAIKVLEFMGVLEIRHAEGTYVSSEFRVEIFNPLLYGIILRSSDSDEIYYFRQAFEVGTILLALSTATNEDIEKIEEAFVSFSNAIRDKNPNIEKIIDCDMTFHQSYFSATHNDLVTAVGDIINRITRYSRFRSMEKIIDNNQIERSLSMHQNLLNIIKNKDNANIESTIAQCYDHWHQLLIEDAKSNTNSSDFRQNEIADEE